MSNTITAAFGVNRYLWQKLSETGILGNNYNGLVPIIPTQEEPTFLQQMEAQAGIGAFPYIVYAWNSNGYGVNYWENVDQIVYIIYSTDQLKLRELTLAITGMLKRYDESADEINKYIATALSDQMDAQGNYLPLFDARYQSYNYKYTSVQAVAGNLAKNEENMPYRAMITVRVGYTHDEDSQSISDLY